MFDREDPNILWISPNAQSGEGTFENPLGSVEEALRKVQPGNSIVLKEGTYHGDLTFQVSGSVEKPITLCADTDARVIIEGACWYFYDTSDIIVSNLTFSNSPYGAISVIGKCMRNRFHSIRFSGCGSLNKTSCTLFFGGSDARFNMVEDCLFERTAPDSKETTAQNTSIALMVSDGDNESSLPLRNHVFRHNTFRNYNYGIIAGSRSLSTLYSGHIVEYNTIENCTADGILVKVGDTQIRGNLIKKCSKSPIAIDAGVGAVIENNRMIDCREGVRVNGPGHTVANNCIIRCAGEAIRVCGSTESEPASNLFIDNNTCVDCGEKEDKNSAQRVAGVRIEPGTSCIIDKNLICGPGKPYLLENPDSTEVQFVVMDNICCSQCTPLHGFSSSDPSFAEPNLDNYENLSEYGASGLMLTPQALDSSIDLFDDGDIDYVSASVLEDDQGERIIPGEDFEGENLFSTIYSRLEIEERNEEQRYLSGNIDNDNDCESDRE